jgi:hypothetical protein
MFVDATGVDPEVGQTVQGSLVGAELNLPISTHLLTTALPKIFDENLVLFPSVRQNGIWRDGFAVKVGQEQLSRRGEVKKSHCQSTTPRTKMETVYELEHSFFTMAKTSTYKRWGMVQNIWQSHRPGCNAAFRGSA